MDETPTGWAWITLPSPVDERGDVAQRRTGGFTSFLGIDRNGSPEW